MIFEVLAGMVTWVLGTILSLLYLVFPTSLLNWATSGFGSLGSLLSHGPAGLVATAFLAYIAIDTGLNAFVFALSTYRMIPFKGT